MKTSESQLIKWLESVSLPIAALVLIEWLLIVAEKTGQWQFYLWSFVVVILWAEAAHHRDPEAFPNRWFRITYFSLYLLMFLALNKGYLYLRTYGISIPGPTPTPTPLLDFLTALIL